MIFISSRTLRHQSTKIHHSYPALKSDEDEDDILSIKIWKAQVISALPELDKIRRDIIQKHIGLWREKLPYRAKYNQKTIMITDAYLLELGHLLRISDLASREGDRRFGALPGYIRPFYEMRNELCHVGHLLSADDLRQVKARSKACGI